MVIASLMILTYNDSVKWYAKNWRWLWFYSSGWPIMLNFVSCLAIAWIFRPQDYNRNYGLNELSDFPLDEEDLELRADFALKALRTGRLQMPDPDTETENARLSNAAASFGGGHSRWNTDNVQPFGADDSDESIKGPLNKPK